MTWKADIRSRWESFVGEGRAEVAEEGRYI